MQNFELIVVTQREIVSDDIKQAWSRAGILLSGPIHPDSVDLEAARRMGGVLLDLAIDSATLFTLAEGLMALKVPFLFISTRMEAAGGAHPFVLSRDRGDRDAILGALAREVDEYQSDALH